MTDSWPIQRLAKASRQPPERLAWLAKVGLLIEQAPGMYAADSMQRLDLIRHAHRRGISDEDIILAVKEQGDLLGVYEELGVAAVTDRTLPEAAREANVPDKLVGELIDLLGYESEDLATTEDIRALELLQQALALGLPEDALSQLIRVFVDTMERLADAEVRIFHDHVHDQFRVQGITGRDLLAATESVGKPALELVEPAVLYF